MAKKIKDLDSGTYLSVNKINDLVHVHTAGRDVGGETDFKIAFLDLFDYGTEPISAAYLYKTNTQTMTANIWNEIAWTTTLYDTDSYVLGDNSGFSTPMDGLYLIYAAMGYDNISAYRYQQGRILFDGASYEGGHTMRDGNVGWQRMMQQHIFVYLAAGVEVTYSMYYETTAPPLTRAGIDENQFSIYRIAGA